MLLAMLAIAMQTFVLQPHVHAPGISQADRAIYAADLNNNQTALAGCSICRVSASARAYTLPPAIVVPARVVFRALAPLAADRSLGATRASHSWRSRAPPFSLR